MTIPVQRGHDHVTSDREAEYAWITLRSVIAMVVNASPAEPPAAHRTNFSPSRALEAVGERWSLLVIREAMFEGTTSFADFQANIGIEPDILAARLDGFVGAGIMSRKPGDHDDHYVLTTQGRNLEPVIVALVTWSDGWDSPPLTLVRGYVRVAEAVRPPDAVALVESDSVAISISLLGTFALRVGGNTVAPLSIGSQRLLVFLALHDRAVARIAMAGAMWPEATEERAGISLRSALSRLDIATRDAILSASAGLSLADTVAVDLRDAQALARRLMQAGDGTDVAEADLGQAAVAALSLELLPDWYDDWVVAEAEEWRQLRMNALEAQARILTLRGRLPEAAVAARAAIKVEPLRESGYAALIRVYLAEGNQSEALRVFDRYRELLDSVLGLTPTSLLSDLVATIRG
ncbi:MAG: hypothetical protein JWR53_933 [Glaciihabitans sp.]|nr:hypothetical protein [Glaciihabitans sp.]